MLQKILKTSAATAIISMMASSAYAAIDAQDVLARLAAQLELQGLVLTADSATNDGSDNILLSGIKVGYGETETFEFDQFALQGVVDAPNDGYVVSNMAVPQFQTEVEGMRFSFAGALIEGYFIAGAAETDPILKGAYYRRVEIGEFNVGPGSSTAFAFSGGEMNISPYEPGGIMEFDMRFDDMMIDFSSAPNPQARETMAALGYEKLQGNITAEGVWDMDTGVTSLAPFKISANDAADLSIAFEIGGYTPQLVAAMQQMQVSMKGNEQAMGMAMLGLMQQLDIRNISIGVDDNSLTGRLIDFFGSQQGMNRESTVALAKGMLPL
ncbi:MAG: hypothetical protein AAGF25_14800, partial [Pseudomonadota bacterium]